ncbi:MAG: heat-inducible transcriptional repressor HrcA [Anaerosomatales bacterium]|nr:heat-inducible transcriptional repressor HrcA [Anaerosomatales bacterium]MDT8433532.1 heat-inducible transcriptional repressor HrcA [Anaerosomatales bacterium]
MLNERRRRVLKALVEEYIVSGQPVGSKLLVDCYHLECSPATVRSELAALEETGYVYQPHVSSGRVPTDTGYRAFVDELLETGEPAVENEALQVRRGYLEIAGEIDELIRQTSVALSHLTHYVAVVMAPTLNLSRIKRVDLVSMGPRRALLVVITESGQVVSRHVALSDDTTPERLAEAERALNASLADKRAVEVLPLRRAMDTGRAGDALLAEITGQVLECLEEADRDRLYHVGVPELLALPEFSDTSLVRPFLTVLEDGLVMLETLSEVMRDGGLTVRIGSENRARELGHMSLVATKYGSESADGIVGVIGPTRMDYSRSIAAVHSAAEGLSEALGGSAENA